MELASLPLNESSEWLRLVYAGNPGKKDLLNHALVGLIQLRKEGIPVRLEILGPSKEVFFSYLKTYSIRWEDLAETLIFHGRVELSQVPSYTSRCDFSILLRPDARFAHAGFPTKLVESMAGGVPVLANLTSNIADFVEDEKEGILLKDPGPSTFVEGVKRVLRLSDEQRRVMRINARRRAMLSFDYRPYIPHFEEFTFDPIHFAEDFQARDRLLNSGFLMSH